MTDADADELQMLRAENAQMKATLAAINVQMMALMKMTAASIAMLKNMLPFIEAVDADAAKSAERAVEQFVGYVATAVERAVRQRNATTETVN